MKAGRNCDAASRFVSRFTDVDRQIISNAAESYAAGLYSKSDLVTALARTERYIAWKRERGERCGHPMTIFNNELTRPANA